MSEAQIKIMEEKLASQLLYLEKIEEEISKKRSSSEYITWTTCTKDLQNFRCKHGFTELEDKLKSAKSFSSCNSNAK
eukprot:Pgem_evm1s3499